MTEVEVKQSIKQIMLFHRGRQNAIKRRSLIEKLGYEFNPTTDRFVRTLISELRREYFPIMFCDKGYFLPASEQERQEGLRTCQSYIDDWCVIKAALKKGGARYIAGEHQVEMI